MIPMSMRRLKTLVTLVVPLLGVLAGIIFQNELFADSLFLVVVFPLVIGFLAIVGLVALVKWLIYRKVGTVIGDAALLGGLLVLAFVLFCATGSGLNRWKVNAVQTYVDRAVPVLDAIKARDGRYPSLLPTDQLGEPPSLLRDDGDYSSDGGGFRFEYVDEPAGWAGGEGLLEFTNSNREWANER